MFSVVKVYILIEYKKKEKKSDNLSILMYILLYLNKYNIDD